MNENNIRIVQDDCLEYINSRILQDVDLTFLDPPFNQDKDYRYHHDNLSPEKYWDWMLDVCRRVIEISRKGAAIYFMQREKNIEQVLEILTLAGWTMQSVIIWKKMTSAIPSNIRYGKQYQIIAFATNGSSPRVFNRLRINPPLPSNYKSGRKNGLYLTDIWDDVRELTSGYYAGEEALRNSDGTRVHKQQTPISLLTRIILSSTNPGDLVFDPFAGTGTTSVAANQLHRKCVSIEIDEKNVGIIERRLRAVHKSDDISKIYEYYRYTKDIDKIWGTTTIIQTGVGVC